MPFTSTTHTIQSVLTDQGRDLLARAQLGQLSFSFSGFQVGRGGYNEQVPVWIEPPDPGVTVLADPVHPIGGAGVAALTTVEAPYPNVVSPVCRVGRTDALYGIGEIGLFVRVVWMPGVEVQGTVMNPEAPLSDAAAFYTVGQDYLFGLAHTPLLSKTDKTVLVFRFIVAL